MRVGQIRTNIEQLSDEVEIFIAWYDRDEAQEHIQNNLMEDFNASSDIVLTEDEWKSIVNKMGNDDGIWNELNESFKSPYINFKRESLELIWSICWERLSMGLRQRVMPTISQSVFSSK
jgi:hypothetical protein